VSGAPTALASLLSARRPGRAEQLLRDATVTSPAFDRIAFELAFASVGRRLGETPLGDGATVSDDARHTWSVARWGLDELGRALLVLAGLAHVDPAEQPAWIDGLHRAGALRERQAVLRVLPLLPEPARFLPTALDACRTSTQPVFEAIACENPYPAAYFPEAAFNQMALKAVFTGVALARILGLASRRTPELARMASDYADERRAAGRPVPADLRDLIDA
jgi:hypothetical protein